jgi:hypothetical protein
VILTVLIRQTASALRCFFNDPCPRLAEILVAGVDLEEAIESFSNGAQALSFPGSSLERPMAYRAVTSNNGTIRDAGKDQDTPATPGSHGRYRATSRGDSSSPEEPNCTTTPRDRALLNGKSGNINCFGSQLGKSGDYTRDPDIGAPEPDRLCNGDVTPAILPATVRQQFRSTK